MNTLYISTLIFYKENMLPCLYYLDQYLKLYICIQAPGIDISDDATVFYARVRMLDF